MMNGVDNKKYTSCQVQRLKKYRVGFYFLKTVEPVSKKDFYRANPTKSFNKNIHLS